MDLEPGEELIFEGHPSWRSILEYYLKGLAATAVAGGIAWLVLDSDGARLAVVLGVLGLVALIGLIKRIATTYVITTDKLHIRRGIIARRTQETRLDRVQNVNTSQSVLERILQVGTVDFDTAGSDDFEFAFAGVAEPEDVVRAVERARRAAESAPGATGEGA